MVIRHWHAIALLAVGAVTAGGLGLSCGYNQQNCTKGTLRLDIALFDDAPLADTINVKDDDIGAILDASFPHTPMPMLAGAQEHISIVVTWPEGFPAKHLVNLKVTALANGKVVGYDAKTVRLGDVCTETGSVVGCRDPITCTGAAPDAGSDGGS